MTTAKHGMTVETHMMCVSWGKLRLHRLISHGPASPLLLFFGPLVRYLLKRLNKNAKNHSKSSSSEADSGQPLQRHEQPALVLAWGGGNGGFSLWGLGMSRVNGLYL